MVERSSSHSMRSFSRLLWAMQSPALLLQSLPSAQVWPQRHSFSLLRSSFWQRVPQMRCWRHERMIQQHYPRIRVLATLQLGSSGCPPCTEAAASTRDLRTSVCMRWLRRGATSISTIPSNMLLSSRAPLLAPGSSCRQSPPCKSAVKQASIRMRVCKPSSCCSYQASASQSMALKSFIDGPRILGLGHR